LEICGSAPRRGVVTEATKGGPKKRRESWKKRSGGRTREKNESFLRLVWAQGRDYAEGETIGKGKRQ